VTLKQVSLPTAWLLGTERLAPLRIPHAPSGIATIPAGGMLRKHRCATPRSGRSPQGWGHSPASAVELLTLGFPAHTVSPVCSPSPGDGVGPNPSVGGCCAAGGHPQPLPEWKHPASPQLSIVAAPC